MSRQYIPLRTDEFQVEGRTRSPARSHEIQAEGRGQRLTTHEFHADERAKTFRPASPLFPAHWEVYDFALQWASRCATFNGRRVRVSPGGSVVLPWSLFFVLPLFCIIVGVLLPTILVLWSLLVCFCVRSSIKTGSDLVGRLTGSLVCCLYALASGVAKMNMLNFVSGDPILTREGADVFSVVELFGPFVCSLVLAALVCEDLLDIWIAQAVQRNLLETLSEVAHQTPLRGDRQQLGSASAFNTGFHDLREVHSITRTVYNCFETLRIVKIKSNGLLESIQATELQRKSAEMIKASSRATYWGPSNAAPPIEPLSPSQNHFRCNTFDFVVILSVGLAQSILPCLWRLLVQKLPLECLTASSWYVVSQVAPMYVSATTFTICLERLFCLKFHLCEMQLQMLYILFVCATPWRRTSLVRTFETEFECIGVRGDGDAEALALSKVDTEFPMEEGWEDSNMEALITCRDMMLIDLVIARKEGCCARGHTLQPSPPKAKRRTSRVHLEALVVCKSCEESIVCDTIHYSCDLCNYDLCPRCYEALQAPAAGTLEARVQIELADQLPFSFLAPQRFLLVMQAFSAQVVVNRVRVQNAITYAAFVFAAAASVLASVVFVCGKLTGSAAACLFYVLASSTIILQFFGISVRVNEIWSECPLEILEAWKRRIVRFQFSMLQLAKGVSQDRVLIDSFFEGAIYPVQDAIEHMQNERVPFIFYGIPITVGFRNGVLGCLLTGALHCLFRIMLAYGWLDVFFHRFREAAGIEVHAANWSYKETGSLEI